MRKLIPYLNLLVLTFPGTEIQGQHTSYFLDDYPAVFSAIDKFAGQDEMDSVLFYSDLILKGDQNDQRKGIALFYKGLAAASFGQYEAAGFSFDEAETLFRSENYRKGLALVYNKKGDLLLTGGDRAGAARLYDLSIQHAGELELNNILSDVYQKKASLDGSVQASDTAMSYLKAALHFAVLGEDIDQQKNILNQVATSYHSKGMLDSAIIFFKKGLELKNRLGDRDGLISDYSALGNLYRERGDYKSAQLMLTKALNIAETDLDSFSMATILSETGDIYAAQRIWNVSEDYYSRSLGLARSKGSGFMEAGCLKKLGHIFNQQQKDSAAIENYEAALAIYSGLKNKTNIAEVLVSLSQLYQSKSQYEKVKALLQEALETSSRSQDLMSSMSAELALADIEIRLGNYSEGIALALDCYDVFQKMDDRDNLRHASLLLSGAYARTGDYRKAYQFHVEYSMLHDSLISVERAEAIKKYDLLNTTKKKDTEIAMRNEEIQDQRVALLRKNNQLFLLSGGLGFIGLVAAFLFFAFQKNKQLNQQRIRVLKKEQEAERLHAMIEGEEKERKRFARELHDGLGAVLSTVKMQINGIPRQFPTVQDSDPYRKAESLIDDACRTVREVSHDLMPYVLEQQGLISAIDEMCRNLANQHGIEVDFIPFGEEQALSGIMKITLYRITQELLKNMTKHAKATEAIVQLMIDDEEISLIIEDNGKGFDPAKSRKGIGLENIQSRTAYLNGRFEIESTIGKGSTFYIQFPLKPSEIHRS